MADGKQMIEFICRLFGHGTIGHDANEYFRTGKFFYCKRCKKGIRC